MPRAFLCSKVSIIGSMFLLRADEQCRIVKKYFNLECLAGGYKGAIIVVMIALAIVTEVIINCYINFTNRC